MLVYGIRCAPNEVSALPKETVADYYMDYGLLVFPSYSKPLTLTAHNNLSVRFWAAVKRIVEGQRRVQQMDLEHPYITETEDAAIKVIKEAIPTSSLSWYYVPMVAKV